MESKTAGHVVEAEFQLMAPSHPTVGIVDFPVVVDLLQAARSVAESGHSGDIRGAQTWRSAVPVRIGDAQLFGQRRILRIRVVDALKHARITHAQLIVFRRSEGSPITEDALLARNHDLARPGGSGADGGFRQVAGIESI